MFTGIIEETGIVREAIKEGNNLRLVMSCSFAPELKPDQSVSHNGVCLTVVAVSGGNYEVVIIEESLRRSNLGALQPGDRVNLERSLRAGDRIDGHFVQGHVDETATVKDVRDAGGSREIHFAYNKSSPHITVSKGSVCVNGVSLTVVDSADHEFSVAVIPYTLEHTNLSKLKPGDSVNLEFDILGKYLQKIVGARNFGPEQ